MTSWAGYRITIDGDMASDKAHHITGFYMVADGGYSMLGT